MQQGRLTATDDVAAAVHGTEVSFISVGTPSAADGSVALGAVDGVIKAIGAAIRDKPGPHAVVMRSTVPPGTAEDRVIPLLEAASGRRLGDGLSLLQQPGIPARRIVGARFPRAAVHPDRRAAGR